MMTNLLHGAHVANKLFSIIARLRLLLVMFLTLTISANVWGADVNFIAGTDKGETSVTKDGITVSMSTMSRDDNYRTYASTAMNVSSETATITKIVITCTGSGTNNYGPGKFSGTGYTYSNSTGTWTGSSSSISLTASAQVRITKIVVTYETAAAQTYNVTLSRNGVTETINDVEEGTALDDIDGTGDQGGCSPDWEFEGWSKTQRPAQNNTAVMDLVTTVDGAGPYYAVYSHTDEGGGGSSTATMSSFSTVSGNVNNDANVSYIAAQGSASTAPAVNSSEIRIYQNGGTLTITGNNGKKLTSITIGSSMATSVSYKIDGGTESLAQSISANGEFTLNDIEASSVLFTCKGTDKYSRLYLKYLSVTYSGGNTIYYTTSPSCSTEQTVYLIPKCGDDGGGTWLVVIEWFATF